MRCTILFKLTNEIFKLTNEYYNTTKEIYRLTNEMYNLTYEEMSPHVFQMCGGSFASAQYEGAGDFPLRGTVGRPFG